MRRANAVAALCLALTPLAAQAWGWGNAITGSGRKATEQRAVGEFSAVRLEGSLDVEVKVGEPRAVAVTIDDNLLPLVKTHLDGDTLVIECQDMSYRGEGKVRVETPSLRALTIEGSGDATIEGGQGDLRLAISGSGDVAWRGSAGALAVAIKGSGDARLAGTADTADLGVKGSGDIKARDLTARSARVAVAGSGDVEVTLSGGTLSAAVAGSGDVHWYGTAQVEQAAVSGSGQISHH